MNLTIQSLSKEEELAEKRRELEAKTLLLAERELELASLRSELAYFERVYMKRVGRLYVELDELRAKIAWRRARENRKDEAAQEEATAKNEQAWRSREEYERSQRMPVLDLPPEKAEDLKAVYRRLAKACHPDATVDPQEKERRTRLMADINAAYASGDLEKLLQLEQELKSSPDTVSGEGIVAELSRISRQITQIDRRLQEIVSEIDSLKSSPLWQLYQQAKSYEARGVDMLAELADRVKKQIEEYKRQTEKPVQARSR